MNILRESNEVDELYNKKFKKIMIGFAVGVIGVLLTSTIYAGNNTQYQVDEVQVDMIFQSEQMIREQYNLNLGTDEEEEKIEIQIESESIVENVEETTIEGIEKIEIEEIKVEQGKASRNKEIVVTEGEYLWPLIGYTELSSSYGPRNRPYKGFHRGIDIPAPSGTNILAITDGKVIESCMANGYGNMVRLQHKDGSCSLYAHMIKRNVEVGQEVKQGDVLGFVGTTGRSTGNHLHLEIWLGLDSSTRVDPLKCFNR